MAYCEVFMREAIRLAQECALKNEVPVGAVIVKNGKIIATGQNERESSQNSLAHAEIIAISKACEAIGNWRLCDCDLYVTLEPCPMCAGAILMSRLKRVYFGAYDTENGGFCRGVLELVDKTCDVYGGILEKECQNILSDFFKKNR